VPLIGGLLESKGISKEVASIIVQAWRPGTQKQYKYYLQKWEQHCCERSINPISPNIRTAIDFLHEFYKEGLSYSTLNTVRSALSSIVQPIDHFTFGNHPLVTRYMQGVFVNRPALPRYKQYNKHNLYFVISKKSCLVVLCRMHVHVSWGIKLFA
jgi:hypothetical protein